MDLACLRCGGLLSPEAARTPVICRYCGATSVPPPAVERVVERIVERVVVERASGTARSDDSDPARLPCPRCAAWLTERRVGKATLASCRDSCGGLWIDTATVERLKRAHDEELERTAHQMDRMRQLLASPPDLQGAIACPVCRGPLRRVAIEGTLHSVDVCDPHGTWFDRARGDELRMFVDAFEAARAGEVTDDDLRAAGVGGGFFARLFGPRG